MRKLATFVVLVLLAVTMLPINSFAAEVSGTYDEIIYLDNGDYITVEISITQTRATTVNSDKTYIYRKSNGEEQWRANLYGTFVYDGTTSTCTQGSCDVIITASDWSVSSKNVVKSGGTVSCDLVMAQKIIGITINTKELNMSMTCSPTGVFS